MNWFQLASIDLIFINCYHLDNFEYKIDEKFYHNPFHFLQASYNLETRGE